MQGRGAGQFTDAVIPHSVHAKSALDQSHDLGTLFLYGFFAFLLVYCIIDGRKQFRAFDGWKRWTGFFPLAGYLILGGGVWAWFGYFMGHNSAVIWPVIVLGILGVMVIVRSIADNQHREEIAKRQLGEFNPRPVFGSKKPEANPDDLKKGRWVD